MKHILLRQLDGIAEDYNLRPEQYRAGARSALAHARDLLAENERLRALLVRALPMIEGRIDAVKLAPFCSDIRAALAATKG